MRETKWEGPNSTVTIRNGSSQPPAYVLNLIDRILHRERPRSAWIELRWTWDTNGNSRGLCMGPRFISVRGERASEDRTRYIVMHEMAHAMNAAGDRHGDGFYDALVRIAKDEGALRMVYREHGVTHAMAPLKRAAARNRRGEGQPRGMRDLQRAMFGF